MNERMRHLKELANRQFINVVAFLFRTLSFTETAYESGKDPNDVYQPAGPQPKVSYKASSYEFDLDRQEPAFFRPDAQEIAQQGYTTINGDKLE